MSKNDFKVHPQPLKSNSIIENPFGLDLLWTELGLRFLMNSNEWIVKPDKK